MNYSEYFKNFIKENHSKIIFYHGSMEELPVGTILKPNDNYEDVWSNTDFYHILEIQKSLRLCKNNQIPWNPKNLLNYKL